MTFLRRDAFAAGFAVGLLTTWIAMRGHEAKAEEPPQEEPPQEAKQEAPETTRRCVSINTPVVHVSVYDTPNLGRHPVPKKEKSP